MAWQVAIKLASAVYAGVKTVGAWALANPATAAGVADLGVNAVSAAKDIFTGDSKPFTRENLGKMTHGALEIATDGDKLASVAQNLNNVAVIRNSIKNEGVLNTLKDAQKLDSVLNIAGKAVNVFGMGQEQSLSMPLNNNLSYSHSAAMKM